MPSTGYSTENPLRAPQAPWAITQVAHMPNETDEAARKTLYGREAVEAFSENPAPVVSMEFGKDGSSVFTKPPPRALDTQVGGAHYKDLKIQPVEFIHANNIGYFEGNVIKYVSRWRSKNGIADLEKAKHYIELLIELETAHAGVEKAQGAHSPSP